MLLIEPVLRIRDPVLFLPWIRIRDEHPTSFLRELRRVFWVDKKILWSGSQDFFDPGSGLEKLGSGIRHKHPGSATLHRNRFHLICLFLCYVLLHPKSCTIVINTVLLRLVNLLRKSKILSTNLFWNVCWCDCFIVLSPKKIATLINLGEYPVPGKVSFFRVLP